MKSYLVTAALIALSAGALAAPINDSYRPKQSVVSSTSAAPRSNIPELGREKGHRTANPNWEATSQGSASVVDRPSVPQLGRDRGHETVGQRRRRNLLQ